MILFSLGFVSGVLFCIAWVFVEFGLECAKLAGRKWSWKHGFSKHAAQIELERLNEQSKFQQAIQAASEMTQEQRDALFGKNLNRQQDQNGRRD